MGLIRLICDSRIPNQPDADLVILPKPEVKRYDEATVRQAEKKFHRVVEVRGRRAATGWPRGPNALAMDAFAFTHKLWKAGQFSYTAAMLLESDCVPLYPDWVYRLTIDYKERRKLVVGHLQFDPAPHINGNLLFHPALFDLEPDLAFGPTPARAWDIEFYPKIRPYSAPSDLIINDYRLNTPKNPWKGVDHLYKPRAYTHPHPFAGKETRQVYVHGVKGSIGIQSIRERWGLPPDRKLR